MSLTTASDILTITTALGVASTSLQATINTGDSTSCLSKLVTARQQIDTSQAEADFDAATTWMSALRTNEESVQTLINDALDTAVEACNTYFVNEQSSTFKAYWHGRSSTYLVAFTTAFRSLWRTVRAEELCILLSSKTKSSGTWQATLTSTVLGMDTTLELRTGSAIGVADIVVTLTLTKSDATVDVVVMTVPAGAAIRTCYSINDTNEYLTITGISCTGGTNGDIIEVWVRP